MNRFKMSILAFLLSTQCHATENANSEMESVKYCKMDHRNFDAINYVGTRSSGGVVQLGLLQSEGLQKDDYVLEIGCGALMSSIPIMTYLNVGHFVGIDPNEWIRNASLEIPENYAVVAERQPIFLSNYDFDASEVGISFDYIFAHSIMSHAAHWQLPLFLENCSKVLKDGGKVVFSIRLTEPNEYGGEGAEHETRSENWVYPGVSYFDKETVILEASRWFSKIEHKVEFTKILTDDYKGVCHDWFVLTKHAE